MESLLRFRGALRTTSTSTGAQRPAQSVVGFELLLLVALFGAPACIDVGPFQIGDIQDTQSQETDGASSEEGAGPDTHQPEDANQQDGSEASLDTKVDAQGEPDADGAGDFDTTDGDADWFEPDGDTIDAEIDAGIDASDGSDDGTEPSDSEEGGGDAEEPIDPLNELNDEFNGSGPVVGWSALHEQLGGAAPWKVAEQSGGAFVLVPTNGGWFESHRGPFLYQLIEGNFSAIVGIRALAASNPALPPANPFSVGGLMARDAASTPTNEERWVLVEVGRQQSVLGTSAKSTVWDNVAGATTTKPEQPGGHEGELILCRIGATFRSFRRLSTDVEWIELPSFTRPDLPDTLQVGMMAGAWPPEAPPSADLRVEFDYVRFASVEIASDCLAVHGDLDGN